MDDIKLRKAFDVYFFDRIKIDEEYRKVYNYILGLYLGDGCISGIKNTKKFRIFLDDKYPNIVNETMECLGVLFPYNKTNVRNSGPHCKEVYMYNSHLETLFPQHGRGEKHERDVSLKEWQKKYIIYEQLALGLFHSDGCYYESRIKNKSDPTKEYIYKNYGFKNCSIDIIEIYKECLDNFGVEYRVVNAPKPKPHLLSGRAIISKTQAYDVVVSKRDAVKKLNDILRIKT